MGLRTGIAVAVAELTKRVIHRTRPDGSDRKSFFSEHTAVAAVTSGWRYGMAFTIGTGYLRPAADKHFLTDVGFGAGVGALTRRACQP